MTGWLDSLDIAGFHVINGLHAPWLDVFMYAVSSRWFWVPVYVLLLYALVKRTGWRDALVVAGLAALTILLADQLASGVLKPWVARLRPCHRGWAGIHLVDGYCGGQYGFVSSHAANFFALAVLMRGVLRPGIAVSGLFFAAAALVAYSRVYLGVHFPGDVLCGAVLGMLCGWAGLQGWRYYLSRKAGISQH